MKACIYPAHIKKSNLGDVLINTLLIRELSKHCPVFLYGGDVKEMKPLLVMNNPYHHQIFFVSQGSTLDNIPILRWIKLIQYLPQLSHVFDPPGHYSEEKVKRKALLKPLKYILRAKILKLFGIKALRLGVTMGPFSDSGWEMQKKVAKSYQTIAVRDSKNYEELIKRKVENISFIDDISFLYQANDFINKANGQSTEPYVIVSFRGSIEGKYTDAPYLEKVTQTLKQVVLNNPFEGTYIFSYQVEEDYAVIQSIAKELAQLGVRYKIIEKQLTFSEAIELYYGASYVYTNRLHVALLAMYNGAAAVAITDVAEHHKLTNVYQDLGLNNILIDCNGSIEHTFPLNSENLKEIMTGFEVSSARKRKSIQDQLTHLLAE